MNSLKTFRNFSFAIGASLLLFSCSTARVASQINKSSYSSLSVEDKMLADTLIKNTLENEGLFTVIGGLKPMSGVTDMYLQIANPDTSLRGKAKITNTQSDDFKKLKRYQNIVNALQFGDLKYMIAPYAATQGDKRTIAISVHRTSLVDSLMNAEQEFFGQFGFVPGSSPEIIINTTEYEHRYNRYRAYGYLFGYPTHAVDFFTDASIIYDKTKTFVKRSFLQIPVYSSPSGRFVYAIEENKAKTPVDEAIMKRAAYHLEIYKQARTKFERPDGTVKYYDLLLSLLK